MFSGSRCHTPSYLFLTLVFFAVCPTLGGDFFKETSHRMGGLFHLLDPSQLLRIVQAAEIMAQLSERLTPIMAFDLYLMERAKLSMSVPHLDFDVILKVESELKLPLRLVVGATANM
jgi:hypothetical protein